jgi:hypothetical protein
MSILSWRFIAEKDLGSRAISWFGGGSFSHVDLVMPDGTFAGARTAADGAKAPGYQIRPVDYIKPARSIVMSLEVTSEQADAVFASSNAKLGDPYDHIAIWGFVLGRNWAEPGAWICSEAQVQNMVCAKICHPIYLTANKITPNDLTILLSGLGATWPRSEA